MRDLLVLNRRIRFVATVVALIGIGTGLFVLARTAPYGIAKLVVEHQMSKIFKQRVTIDSMSGNVISQATFKGIRFYNNPKFGHPGIVFEIGEATAHYSLIKTMTHNGDFAAGTHTLNLKNVRVNAHKNTADLWNVLMILPPPEPGGAPLTFKGRIYFKNMTIQYIDDKGWGHDPAPHPFTDTFHSMDGIADFRDITNARLVWKGALGTLNSPITIIGNLNTTNGQWGFTINADRLPLAKWGPYVVPQKGVQLGGQLADVSAQIQSKYRPKHGEFPFWFNTTLILTQGRLKIPVFPTTFQGINGYLHLTNTPNPTTMLRLDIRSAMIGTSSISAKGLINLDRGNLNLQLYSNSLQVSAVKALFPSISEWKIIGSGIASASITGTMSSPNVRGMYQLPESKAYGFPVAQLGLVFSFLDHRLKIESTSGIVHDGLIQLSATLNTHTKIPHIDAELHSTLLDTGLIGKTHVVDGRLSTSIRVAGPTPRLALTLHATSDTGVRWMNQKIRSADITGWVLDGINVVVDHAYFKINDSTLPVHAYGLIRGWKTAEFAFEGADIELADIDPAHIGPGGRAFTHGHLFAALTPEFWDSPRSTLVVTGNGHIDHYTVYGQPFDQVNFDVTMTPSTYELRELTTHFNDETMTLQGRLVNGAPQSLMIRANRFSVLENSMLQKYIPASLKPFQGYFSGSAIIEGTGHPSRSDAVLSQLLASGNMRIDTAQVRGQTFDSLMWVGEWNGSVLTTTRALIQQHTSIIALAGRIDTSLNMTLQIQAGTQINLSDFSASLQPILGTISGDGAVSGSITGNVKNPTIILALDFENIQWGGVQLRQIRGGVGIQNNRLLAQNLIIQPKKGQFNLNGYFNLAPISEKDTNPLDYDLALGIAPMSLDALSDLIESVRREWIIRFRQDMPAAEPVVKNANVGTKRASNPFLVEDPELSKPVATLYNIGTEDHSLALLNTVRTRQKYVQFVSDIGLADILSGTLTGKIHTRSRQDQAPEVTAQLEFTDATLSFLRGKKINFDIIPQGDELAYKLTVQKGDMGGSSFDLFVSEGTYNANGYLTIQKSEVNSGAGQIHSILSGKFPLSGYWNPDHLDHPMDIRLTWDKDDVNILAIFVPYLKRVTNRGQIVLRLEGPLLHPVLSTEKVELVNAAIILNDELVPLQSPLQIVDGSFSIQSNTMILNGLTFQWRGPDTIKLGASTPETNRISINGTVTIDRLRLIKPDKVDLTMALNFGNSALTINFPQIYHGQVELQELKINGPYSIPISKGEKDTQREVSGTDRETGPVISGGAQLVDGELSLPTLGEKPIRPTFLFNIRGSIGQNTRLVGSLVGDGLWADVANRFNLSLAKSTSPIIITGTFNAPRIRNSITVSTGFINLLNRQFEILSIDRQRDYFRGSQYKVHNNTVEFQTDYSSTKNKLIPQLNITALTVIEPLVQSTSNSVEADATKYAHILVTIRGPVYNLQGFQFEKYVSARSDTTDRLDYRGMYGLGLNPDSQNSGDAAEIARMLAPELLDAQTQNGNDNVFIRQVGSGAVNYISQVALRGIERDLAKNIGVDDIQISYKLGEAVFGGISNHTVGVSVAKSLLSNQLYIRARTDVDVERRKYSNTLQLSEVELTYYLEKYWSLNYANFIDDAGDSKNRYNIKYSYEF
jgi:hypothetical protein